MTNYLIFDFDGVLADSLESCVEVHIDMWLATTQQEALEQALQYSNNPVDHAKDHVMTEEQMKNRLNFMQRWWDAQSSKVFDLFFWFIEEISSIQNKLVAIVSSNSIQTLECKKNILDLLQPTHMFWFEDHHSKEEKIEMICRDRWVDISEVFYFTDTKADVYELQNSISPDKLIGCARGFSGYDALVEVLPEPNIMRNFDDIHRYVL